MAEAIHGFLEGDGGEVDSMKCEIMVLRPCGKVRHCDLTSHSSLLLLRCVPPAVLNYCLVHDTSTQLLYVPHVGERKYRIHESKRRRRSTRHILVFAASRDPSHMT